MTITIDFSSVVAEELQAIRIRMADGAGIHAAMAGAAEIFVKEYGRDAASRRHESANSLGATPTGHLEQAYRDIEAQSDASAARLLVPRASRLRAAFGPYTVKPKAGKKYLTIPVSKAAYGKRAGEFNDLYVVKKGPKGRQKLFLARDGTGEFFETMFRLVPSASFKEDRSLIPFEDIPQQAADAAELFILTGPAT